jgi:hypothetical protein
LVLFEQITNFVGKDNAVMIHSNPNPQMTAEEIRHFRTEVTRRMSGKFTTKERERIRSRKEVYDTILERNGGKNPLFGL